jgi:C-terminal processing protease CtpA/Prc
MGFSSSRFDGKYSFSFYNNEYRFNLGGNDFPVPLSIQLVSIRIDEKVFLIYSFKVNPNTPAHTNGLEAGDQVISINNNNVTKLTHQEAKMEITRAGNELVLTVIKCDYQSS